MAVFLSPLPFPQFIPGGNSPANGAQLFQYQSGTSTKQSTFTTSSGAVSNANPIVLDSGGSITGSREIWLTQGQMYRYVLAPSNDTDPPSSPYWTMDSISGINDISGLSASGEWILGTTPTFVGATSFTVVGDQTAIYTVGRRVKTVNTGGTVYSTITASVSAAGVTTVTVVNDSGTIDSGLSAVSYGLLSTPDGSIPFTQVRSAGLDFSSGVVTTGALTVTGALRITSNALTFTNASTASLNTSSGTALQLIDVAYTARNLTITPATSSGTVAIGVTGGNLSIGGNAVSLSSTVNIGVSTATSGAINIAGGAGAGLGVWGNGGAIAGDLQMIALNSRNFVLIGGGGSGSNSGMVATGITSTGPVTNLTLPNGTFCILRDVSASTTRFYYNNGGTIQSSAPFS